MDRIRWCDIFPIGARINVGYTRFPNEFVVCTGEILEINEKTETLKIKYLNGFIRGNWEISFREAFILNYQRQPLHNPPKEEN